MLSKPATPAANSGINAAKKCEQHKMATELRAAGTTRGAGRENMKQAATSMRIIITITIRMAIITHGTASC